MTKKLVLGWPGGTYWKSLGKYKYNRELRRLEIVTPDTGRSVDSANWLGREHRGSGNRITWGK